MFLLHFTWGSKQTVYHPVSYCQTDREGFSMANKSKATFRKMEKEKARQQKQKEKEARRLQSKTITPRSTPQFGDEDPDIAGIRPGPQPLPEQWNNPEKE
jgi:hypothetical protein